MRIVILDDQLTVGTALGFLLAPKFEVAGVLHDWTQLDQYLKKHPTDIVLVDGTLPRCDISKLIRHASLRVRVIVMTMYNTSSTWPGLRRMGATGIVSKSLAPDEFVAEVERLAKLEEATSDGERDARVPEPMSRQVEILICMAAGLVTKQIATVLELAQSRTSELIADVLRLTGTHSWAEAVMLAVEHGWIEPRVPPDSRFTGTKGRPSSSPNGLPSLKS
jgi:DNA-binding NarL/FixJ family response regulator